MSIADFAEFAGAAPRRASSEPDTSLLSWRDDVLLRRRSGNTWTTLFSLPNPAFAKSYLSTTMHLEQIERILSSRPAPGGDVDDQYLLYIPARSPKGFDITVLIEGAHIGTSFGGLQHEFATIQETLKWVSGAALGRLQLIMTTFGGLACKWTLSPNTPGHDASETLQSGIVSVRSLFFSKHTTVKLNSF
jgi:hypothetical protein